MKLMKKLISTFLVLLLAAASVPVSAAGSSDDPVPVISVGTQYASKGDSVDVDIMIQNNPGIIGIDLEISYDVGLTLKDSASGEAFSFLTMTKPGIYGSPCKFTWDGQEVTESDIKDGVILSLSFDISEDAEDGSELGISVKVGDAYDNNLNSLDIKTSDGAVQVDNLTPGDLNSDGKINITDIILARRYMVGGYDVSINERAADVNDDGRVTTADVILIRRYLAGGYGVQLKHCSSVCIHSMKAMSAKAATCTDPGNIAYWQCSKCSRYFSDAAGLHEINLSDTVIEATGHTIVIDKAVEPTALKSGLTEGKHCSVCGTVLVPQEEWKLEEYTVEFSYDDQTEDLFTSDISLTDFTYSSDESKTLPVLSMTGYTFIGWSDADGNLCTEIPKGSTGNKVYYANWSSNRCQAWQKNSLDDPVIYDDEKDDQILFAYEIGEIKNVPLCTIEDFGRTVAGGVAQTITKDITVQTESSMINSYAETAQTATTLNGRWTLSDDWNSSISVIDDWNNDGISHVTDVVNNDTYMISSDGSATGSAAASSGNYSMYALTYNSDQNYDNSSQSYKNNAVELEYTQKADLNLNTDGKISKGDLEPSNLNIDGSGVQKTTDSDGSTTTLSISDDNAKSHTASSEYTSSWNSSAGYTASKTTSSSSEVSEKLSELISEQTGYGSGTSGDSALNMALISVTGDEEQYSSAVRYPDLEYTDTVTLTTASNTNAGYHRWVVADTAHVYGVVAYDKVSKSYYTYTYSLMEGNPYQYEDYSYNSAAYDDSQRTVINFEIPDAITDYVYAKTFGTEGLVYDLAGNVTNYNGEDSFVFIPDYVSVSNSDGTEKLIKVTGIREGAFANENQITGVYLSDFITEIPDNAFAGCSELRDVSGANVTSIGDHAFTDCTKLRSFNISSSVTSLGTQAFSGTDFLEVEASSSDVVKAALDSGASQIVIDLKNMTDTLDETTLTIPEETNLIVFRGYGKTYNNLSIVSYAESTILNRLSIRNTEALVPLYVRHDEQEDTGVAYAAVICYTNVTLCQLSLESSSQAMILRSHYTHLGLSGNVNVSSYVGNAVFCKYLDVSGIDSEIKTSLNVTGNIVTTYSDIIDKESLVNMKTGTISYAAFSEWCSMLDSDIIYLDPQEGTCDIKSVGIPQGAEFGSVTLPVPTRDYYTFDGWYTEAEDGTKVTETTKLSDLNSHTLYAHWTMNAPSEWVKESEVPDDAQIVDTKWTYTKRSYTTSGSSSLSGWNLYNSSYVWGSTQGPVYYDPSNGERNVWSETYETKGTHFYKYYRYTDSNGTLSSPVPTSTCGIYEEIDLTLALSETDSNGGYKYYNKVNIYPNTYRTYWFLYEWDDITYGTRWYYQDRVYTYYFYKDEQLESTSDPTGQSDVSNVTKYVKYREK